ncbi:MAG: glycosyltransferase [Candidatus Helarchaeota archaeon]
MMIKNEQQIKGSILLFQSIVSHYRVPIFEELYKRFGVIVCHSKEPPKSILRDKGKSLSVPHFEVKRIYLSIKKMIVIQDILTPIIKFRPKIIITEFAIGLLSCWLLILLKTIFGYRLILWGHGWNRRKGFQPNSLQDRMRIWAYKRTDAVILYSFGAYNTLNNYLRSSQKLFVAPNTLDTKSLLQIKSSLEAKGKESIKNKWGINNKYLLIFIGRLLKGKRLIELIDIFKKVQTQIDDVGLIIVGEGPERINIEKTIMNDNLNSIYLLGEINAPYKTGELLYIADILVNPGYLGLSVIHTFCFDTPIVSQLPGPNGPFHSPEVEYVKDCENGFLVPSGDKVKMVEVIIKYLRSHELQDIMIKNVKRTIIERADLSMFLKGFGEAIDYTMRTN